MINGEESETNGRVETLIEVYKSVLRPTYQLLREEKRKAEEKYERGKKSLEESVQKYEGGKDKEFWKAEAGRNRQRLLELKGDVELHDEAVQRQYRLLKGWALDELGRAVHNMLGELVTKDGETYQVRINKDSGNARAILRIGNESPIAIVLSNSITIPLEDIERIDGHTYTLRPLEKDTPEEIEPAKADESEQKEINMEKIRAEAQRRVQRIRARRARQLVGAGARSEF